MRKLSQIRLLLFLLSLLAMPSPAASTGDTPHGVWEGTYQCGKERFPLELVISILPKKSERDRTYGVKAAVTVAFAAGRDGITNRISVEMRGAYGPKMQRIDLYQFKRHITEDNNWGREIIYDLKYNSTKQSLVAELRFAPENCTAHIHGRAEQPSLLPDAWDQLIDPITKENEQKRRLCSAPLASPETAAEPDMVNCMVAIYRNRWVKDGWERDPLSQQFVLPVRYLSKGRVTPCWQLQSSFDRAAAHMASDLRLQNPRLWLSCETIFKVGIALADSESVRDSLRSHIRCSGFSREMLSRTNRRGMLNHVLKCHGIIGNEINNEHARGQFLASLENCYSNPAYLASLLGPAYRSPTVLATEGLNYTAWNESGLRWGEVPYDKKVTEMLLDYAKSNPVTCPELLNIAASNGLIDAAVAERIEKLHNQQMKELSAENDRQEQERLAKLAPKLLSEWDSVSRSDYLTTEAGDYGVKMSIPRDYKCPGPIAIRAEALSASAIPTGENGRMGLSDFLIEVRNSVSSRLSYDSSGQYECDLFKINQSRVYLVYKNELIGALETVRSSDKVQTTVLYDKTASFRGGVQPASISTLDLLYNLFWSEPRNRQQIGATERKLRDHGNLTFQARHISETKCEPRSEDDIAKDEELASIAEKMRHPRLLRCIANKIRPLVAVAVVEKRTHDQSLSSKMFRFYRLLADAGDFEGVGMLAFFKSQGIDISNAGVLRFSDEPNAYEIQSALNEKYLQSCELTGLIMSPVAAAMRMTREGDWCGVTGTFGLTHQQFRFGSVSEVTCSRIEEHRYLCDYVTRLVCNTPGTKGFDNGLCPPGLSDLPVRSKAELLRTDGQLQFVRAITQ